jgi:tetratricopeptide (TPR) repeat protein
MPKLKLALLFFLLPGCVVGQLANSGDPRLKIGHWLQNHTLVTELPECKDAREVFDNLLRVADKPAGVLPQLYVFSNLDFGQVFALPDGSVILPLKVIKFCFKNEAYGKARLAFILGHELKHIVHRDYWTIEQIFTFAQNANTSQLPFEARKAFETQADEYGILYAALAGYDVRAIIGPGNSFIPEYIDSAGIKVHDGLTNNSPEERLKAVNRRLGDILTHLDLFEFGVRLYAIGKYDAAIELLQKFVTQFPSREVYNNLGLCYYQKAREHYAKWKSEAADKDPHLIFRVSVQVDPISRLRTKSAEQQFFHEMIDKAISYLEEAKARDANYIPALNNLGCAYLLKGETDFAKGYFKKAKELDSNCKEALNNLGVADIVEGNATAAEKLFKDALKMHPDYPEPIYNLGRLYQQIGRITEATAYFNRYLQVDSASLHANLVRKLLGKPIPVAPPPNFAESIDGRTPVDSVRSSYGQSNQFVTSTADISIFHDQKQATAFYQFVTKPSRDKIALLRAQAEYPGSSAKGIGIGSLESLVKEKYPYPHIIKETTTGALWVYTSLNLVFEMRSRRVRAWYLYADM